jgi:capsular exopolysaccharide synthesis family protein
MSLALPAFALPAAPGLADQLLRLRRRWVLILACTIAVPAATVGVLATMPLTYTATGVLLYDPDNAVIPGDAANPQDAENQDAVTASQSAVIASLPAAREMVTQLGLKPPRRLPLWPFSRPVGADAAAMAARRNLNVTVQPGSRVLNVAFTSTSPALAAAGANLAMQLYLDHEREQSFAALTDAQAWLEAHSAQVQADLDATETQLAQARAGAGVVQGAEASLTTETASRLAASLVQAQADLAMGQARLNAASGGDAAAASANITPNLLPLRREQADFAAQVQALAGEYGPDYPALVAARTQLAAITAEIQAETDREFAAARAEVAADQAEAATMGAALAAVRTQSQTEDEESAPIRALEQRAEAGRAMLRAMTLQAGELAQDASLTKPDARILSTAAIPASPSPPSRALILAASIALGLCAGLLLAALSDALDTSLRSGEEIRTALGLSCFALLPETKAPQTAGLEAPFSLFSEQLRAVRTGLGLPAERSKIIAITAARPGEGKTTMTIALGRTLAVSGLRVLAIDGDIRQPSFDPVFETGGGLGLTDHLAGLAGLDEIIRHDALSPLCVIGAGTQAKAALSLFLSAELAQSFEPLRARFDVILLDAPPAFALAEGRILARMADAALLCIRWGDTPRRTVRAAILLLQEAGVTLAGAALTRVNVRAHGRSGYADAEVYQPRYGGYFRE